MRVFLLILVGVATFFAADTGSRNEAKPAALESGAFLLSPVLSAADLNLSVAEARSAEPYLAPNQHDRAASLIIRTLTPEDFKRDAAFKSLYAELAFANQKKRHARDLCDKLIHTIDSYHTNGELTVHIKSHFNRLMNEFAVANGIKFSSGLYDRLFESCKKLFVASPLHEKGIFDVNFAALDLMTQTAAADPFDYNDNKKIQVIELVEQLSSGDYFKQLGREFVFPKGFFSPFLLHSCSDQIKNIFTNLLAFMTQDLPEEPELSFLNFSAKKPDDVMKTFVPSLALLNSIVENMQPSARFELLKIILSCPQGQKAFFDDKYFQFNVFKPQDYAPFRLMAMCPESVNYPELVDMLINRLEHQLSGEQAKLNTLFGLLEVVDYMLQNAYENQRQDVYDNLTRRLATLNLTALPHRYAGKQILFGSSFFLPDYLKRIYPVTGFGVRAPYVFLQTDPDLQPSGGELEKLMELDFALERLLDFNSKLLRLLNSSRASAGDIAGLIGNMHGAFKEMLDILPQDSLRMIFPEQEGQLVAQAVNKQLDELAKTPQDALPGIFDRVKGRGGIVNMLHAKALQIYNDTVARTLHTSSQATGEKIYINGATLGVANLTGMPLQDSLTGRILHPYFARVIDVLGTFGAKDIEGGMVRVKKDQISMHLKVGVHFVDLNFTFRSPEDGGQVALSFADSGERSGVGEVGRAQLIANTIRMALGLPDDDQSIVRQEGSFIQMHLDQATGLDSKSRIEEMLDLLISVFGRSRHLNVYFYERTFNAQAVEPFVRDIYDQGARFNLVHSMAHNTLSNDRSRYGREVAALLNRELKRLGSEDDFSFDGKRLGQRAIQSKFIDFIEHGFVTGRFVVNSSGVPVVDESYLSKVLVFFDEQLKKHAHESAGLVLALENLRDPLEYTTVGTRGSMLVQAAVCPAPAGKLIIYVLKDPVTGKIVEACPVMSVPVPDFGTTLEQYSIYRTDIATALDTLEVSNEVYSTDLVDMVLGVFQAGFEHDEALKRRMKSDRYAVLQEFEFGTTISKGHGAVLGRLKFDVPGVKVGPGDILVSNGIEPKHVDVSYARPDGIWVCGSGSLLSHDANVAREHDIPCVVLPAKADFNSGRLSLRTSKGRELVLSSGHVVFMDSHRGALGLWGFSSKDVGKASIQDEVYGIFADCFGIMAKGRVDADFAKLDLVLEKLEKRIAQSAVKDAGLCALLVSMAVDFPEFSQELVRVLESFPEKILYQVVADAAFELKCGFGQSIKDYAHDVQATQTLQQVQLCNKRLLDDRDRYDARLAALRRINPAPLHSVSNGTPAVYRVLKVLGERQNAELIDVFLTTLDKNAEDLDAETLRELSESAVQLKQYFPTIYDRFVPVEKLQRGEKAYLKITQEALDYSEESYTLRSDIIKPLNAATPQIVGNKACQLVRMGERGFSIPVWVFPEIVSTLECAGVWEKIVKTVANPQADTYEKLSLIQSLVRDIRFPEGFYSEIEKSLEWLGADFVAVRTSGVGEDGQLSFAGIGQSFARVRGIDAVVAAVCGVMASGQTPAALEYMRSAGLDGDGLSMPVWIHPTVDSQYSAVVFTKNPSSGRNQVIIQGIKGMLGAVVDGKVTPDMLVMEKNLSGLWVVKSCRIGEKEYFLLTDTNTTGVSLHVTGTRESRSFCLPTEIVAGILEKVEQLQKMYGTDSAYASGMDLEIAVDDQGKVHVVQKRRITSGPFFNQIIETAQVQLLEAV